MVDFNWPVAPDPEQPQPGIKYLATCFRWKLIEGRFNRNTIELWFKIIEPVRWADKVVKKYYAIPIDEPPGPDSNYYKDFVRANGGNLPKRNTRMSPSIFEGWWMIELVYSKQKISSEGGVEKLKEGQQGRIRVEHLIERAAGERRPR
jgi:hypothetical protein